MSGAPGQLAQSTLVPQQKRTISREAGSPQTGKLSSQMVQNFLVSATELGVVYSVRQSFPQSD